MNKQDFLEKLRTGLLGLPKDDLEERVNFYSEMIDDRMEEGLSEEEAVSQMGDADEIISQIIAETPLAKIVKEKIRPNRTMRVWEIVLLVLGSPLWLSILLVVFSVILVIYVMIWVVIICLWAAEVSVAAGAIAGIGSGVMFMADGNEYSGLAMIGLAIFCAGISIFLFNGCKVATIGAARLTKKIAIGIKNMIMGKGRK